MASPGELTRKVAATLGVDEATAATTWRALREAGHVTKGGRGRSAAQVTNRDAATLIFAICGSNTIKDASAFISRANTSREITHYVSGWSSVSVRKELRMSPAWELERINIKPVRSLPTAHSPLDVLEGFLTWAGGARYNIDSPSEDTEAPTLIVKELHITASFEVPDEITRFKVVCVDKDGLRYSEDQSYAPDTVYFDGRTFTDASVKRLRAENYEVRTGDMKTVRTFSLHTLIEVGRFVAGVHDDGAAV